MGKKLNESEEACTKMRRDQDEVKASLKESKSLQNRLERERNKIQELENELRQVCRVLQKISIQTAIGCGRWCEIKGKATQESNFQVRIVVNTHRITHKCQDTRGYFKGDKREFKTLLKLCKSAPSARLKQSRMVWLWMYIVLSSSDHAALSRKACELGAC